MVDIGKLARGDLLELITFGGDPDPHVVLGDGDVIRYIADGYIAAPWWRLRSLSTSCSKKSFCTFMPRCISSPDYMRSIDSSYRMKTMISRLGE